MQSTILETEVVVIGSGPGGYTAAFRAADLGKKVVLIEEYQNLGGVCLNVGCIPSKALLHIAKVIHDADDLADWGVSYTKPKLDQHKMVAWKNKVIGKLTGGLNALAKQRKVQVIQGRAEFVSSHELQIQNSAERITLKFEQAVIAVGSEAVRFPFIPEDPRIFTSTGALELTDIKSDLLVMGGGIIGLEMATVYAALGVKVTVVEFLDQLVAVADADLVAVLQKQMAKQGVKFLLRTKVTAIDAQKDALHVKLETDGKAPESLAVGQILVAVGRKPNGAKIAAEKAGVHVDEKGFIPVDKQMKTNIPHIYAIGDVCGQPMLAHKAIPEGKVAAEVIAGQQHFFEPNCIANVAYTDPELAWVGLTEKQAIEQGVDFEKAVFPWLASGRALSMGREEGLTKLLFCKKTKRVLGAGIVGMNAGELIAEMALAIEMCCDVEDIALTIHPHPTLSETVAQAAEIFAGSITDLYLPKKK